MLKPGGFLAINCPDLQAAAELIAQDRVDQPAYVSGSGKPIRPLDILYGFGEALQDGAHFMAHKTGFTRRTLMEGMAGAGFEPQCIRGKDSFDLWGLGVKPA